MQGSSHSELSSVTEVFASYGIDVKAHADGSVSAEGVAALRLSRRMVVARRAHEIAHDGDLADLAELAATADAFDEADVGERHFVVAPSAVLATVIAVDLAVRVESLLEASDPLEELRFLVTAAESGDIASLGSTVAAAFDLLASASV